VPSDNLLAATRADAPASRQAAQEAVHAWRIVGTGLDALVRTVRLGDASATGLARQLHGHWSGLESPIAEVMPTSLLVEGEVALEANSEGGTWVLPAFMAGLRKVRLRTDATSDDLLRFAHELAMLKPEVPVIVAFRDWLWCDGAEGFDVAINQSFVELADSLSREGSEHDVLATRSTSVIADWNRIAQIAAKELDAAAVREEFGVPIELFQRRATSAEFRLADVEVDSLRRATEDASLWSEAELRVVLRHPSLRGALPPSRLAQRLLALIESSERVDEHLLGFLAALGASHDDYARALMHQLASVELGHALAERLDLARCTVRTLTTFLDAADTTTVRGVVHGLLQRGLGERAALTMALELMRAWKWSRLRDLVDSNRLAQPTAASLLRAAFEDRAPIAQLANFVDTLPPRAASVALAANPRAAQALPKSVMRLLTQAPGASARLVQSLLRTGPAGARAVAEALATSRGTGWNKKMLDAVLEALVAAGLGRESILPLARNGAVKTSVRFAAMRALRVQPELLAEVARWRPGELMEPPEVRRFLRELRTTLKGEP
jgi:hypothetical protein